MWLGWMTWEQILPFKEQIIDWELEVMVKYHYPDKSIPREYPESRVNNLKDYIESGNTFFWGAIENGKLLGYYWGYVSDFLYERTWHSRSSYISEEARGKGLGLMSKEMALEKAKELNCVKFVAMYASFNTTNKHIYEKLGFSVSRIEVMKKI